MKRFLILLFLGATIASGQLLTVQDLRVNGATNLASNTTVQNLTVTGTVLVGSSTTALAPTGTIAMFGGSAAPSGWLLCNGTAYATGTYPDLYAAIGTGFGTGGAGTFKVPDFRGIFPKGNGSSGVFGANYVSTLGSYSQDKFQGHEHAGYLANYGLNGSPPTSETILATTTADPASIFLQSPMSDQGPVVGAGNPWTTPRYGTITEPANVGVNFIIKY